MGVLLATYRICKSHTLGVTMPVAKMHVSDDPNTLISLPRIDNYMIT